MICVAQGSTLLRDKASFDGKLCAAQDARLSDFVRLRSEVRSKLYAVQRQSDNVSDHQVAALDDLATTKRGHRHSGASVGYLIFVFRGRSVPAPDRTMIS